MRNILCIVGFLLFGVAIQNVLSEPDSIEPISSEPQKAFPLCEYYIPEAVADHASAISFCHLDVQQFDGLVSIETPEKLEEVLHYLEDRPNPDPVGTTYWIDGYFDLTNWVWTSKVRMPPNPTYPDWNPWAPGNPINLLTNRPALRFYSIGVAPWYTLINSQMNKFICEKCYPLTEPVPCRETNDLVIVLDSSNSISETNYEIAKHFVAELALAYESHSDNRQGLVVYSSNVTIIFDLMNVLTIPQMNATIRSVDHLRQNTNTADGITVAMEMLLSVQGPDPNPPMNMVVVTDGLSNNNITTKAAADLAILNGIRMFAVGVTNATNQELENIAGGRTDRVFFKEDFEELLNLLRPVSIKVCEDD